MKLIIEGNKKHLDIIKKTNRSRAAKYGLKIYIQKEEEKPKEYEKPKVKASMSEKTNATKKPVKKGK